MAELAAKQKSWRLWGPYLSERQWGTVREDYSPRGDAWNYIRFEDAGARAYRWGEDGIAGISDVNQRLCLAPAFWNGRDTRLKERMFGLTGPQGSHGEDVKELYWYLDAVPTHSYLRMLYKYPQSAFPYDEIKDDARRRSRRDPEFTALESGAFDNNRYFDIVIEYAKADEADILLRVTVHNRGPDAATLRVIPQLWFRNDWSWRPDVLRPRLNVVDENTVVAEHDELGRYILYAENVQRLMFCDNESNPTLWGGSGTGLYKDGIQRAVVDGCRDAVSDKGPGTKLGMLHYGNVGVGASWTTRIRLARDGTTAPFDDFDRLIDTRRREADAFYAVLQANVSDPDSRLVQRQALAGMIWSKQYYELDVYRWLRGDPLQPDPPAERRRGRNADWRHFSAGDILSMPDKWEYPWFASWDTAFHCISLAMVDPAFAKEQLLLLTNEDYMHPNGQIPAYEWSFGDANPPVHAWAAWRVFEMERATTGGRGDLSFLERVFHKLILNFSWWVNRKDAHGRNVFQGGFLGLDNIAVFNRSDPLPTGGHLDQTDGTAWMAMYALNLMRVALELALYNDAFEEIASKFFEHFLRIARAMSDIGEEGVGLWNEADKFFYDVLNLPDGSLHELKLRSMVGLIPLFAVETIEPAMLIRLPNFARRLEVFLTRRPDLAKLVSRWDEPGSGERRLLSLLSSDKLKCVLNRMLDETEFLSAHGIRSLSRTHAHAPFRFDRNDVHISVGYEPGESQTGLYGGNSNWRGPIWMPVNYLIIEALQRFHSYYGDEFTIECPTGSGRYLTLRAVAEELASRLTRLLLKDAQGSRPFQGGMQCFRTDPHFTDLIWFHEYFHGDSGKGLGAAHQTGWTGLMANLIGAYPCA